MLVEEDDFGMDGGSEQNLTFEQRSTERALNDLRTSGYRDGRQMFMEDERLIQTGFDAAYKMFVKLGMLAGQVRSLSASLVKDSATLARLNDKLEKIETFPYETKIEWQTEGNGDVTPLMGPVNQIILEYHFKLSQIKQQIALSNIHGLNENLNNLDVKSEKELEPEESDLKNVNTLNHLIENFGI